MITEAAENGAKLIGFPEAFIPGYPWWVWLSDPGTGSSLYAELYKNSVEIPSIAVQKLSETARKNNIYVCVSVNELDGGSLYLTQLWFNPQGDLIGKHRKMRPSGGERLIWGEGDGSMMPCFKTEIGNLGGLQCWEHWVPLNIMAMNSQNEQVHVGSWPAFFPGDEALVSTPPNLASSQYHALATQSFVIMSTQIHTKEILEKICTVDAQREAYGSLVATGGGNACIIGPNGKIISNQLPADQEGIVYADIDLEKIIECKYQIDPAGHYSNKSLSMNFNQNPQPPVKKLGSSTDEIITYEELKKI
ncbi:carbon-nitrogen hydrolase family protein [Clostridium beijerinckii]|uniref:carbon-nitrogen hydrolase family protein n=1 Tax=Clostridium beijerinckii TaxID=1520 RepID=UPI001EED4F26|nr:carbon-nitrogen hydrolase family protein [Clostridium beijerinckii]